MAAVVFAAAGVDDPDWKDVVARGRAAARTSNYGDAERLFREALQTAEARSDWAQTASALTYLAVFLRDRDQYQAAEPLFVRAIHLYRDHVDPVNLPRALNNLAALHQSQGHFGEAEVLYRDAVDLAAKQQDAPDVGLIAASNLSSILAGRGKFEEAVAVVQVMLTRIGPNPAPTEGYATALNQLGIVYKRLGRYGEAENHLKRSLDQRERTEGRDEPSAAVVLNNLGDLYLLQARNAEATTLLTRAETICANRTMEITRCASILNNLATAEQALGDTRKAEAHLQQVISMASARSDARVPYAAALNNLARIYATQRRFKEATALFQQSLNAWAFADAKNHPDYASTLTNLGALYLQQKKYDIAEDLIRQAIATDERLLGPNHPKLVHELNTLATLSARRKRYSEAEALLRRTVSIFEAAEPDSASLARALLSLGEAVALQKHYPEAAELYGRGFAMLDNLRVSLPENELILLNRYEQILRAIRDYAKAEEISARAMRVRVKAAVALEKSLTPRR